MVSQPALPTHHTLLFGIRLYPTPTTTASNAIVHTPIFSCTLSRTTGLPILCGGAHDPFLSLLKLTDGAGVALLIDGKAVRARDQITRLVAIGRFGGKPAALPIAHGSALKLVASTKKRKMPVFDVLYLEQGVDEDDEPIHASSSASSLSSSSSVSDSGTHSPNQSSSSSSILKRFMRRPKPERQLASSCPDMEGATVQDTELLLRRAGLRAPRSLRVQVRDLAVRQQQKHEQQMRYSRHHHRAAAAPDDVSPDRSSMYSSASSVASSSPSTVSTGSFDDHRRRSIIFSVGPDDTDEPFVWEDEREDPVTNSKRLLLYDQSQYQFYKQGYIVPTDPRNPSYVNYYVQQQQYHHQQLQAQRMQQQQQQLQLQLQLQLGHRKGSSLSSLDNSRRLARIYEEDEE
ncbi:hypothetical protein V1525DRAFT_381676 [Lipomyces kononenkoae]|uniref:Uncharacterized protein n=1 Tax=Lipomyces kononenkoae TaxID=34357 RepID=A0ACC3SUS7_LIPKO